MPPLPKVSLKSLYRSRSARFKNAVVPVVFRRNVATTLAEASLQGDLAVKIEGNRLWYADAAEVERGGEKIEWQKVGFSRQTAKRLDGFVDQLWITAGTNAYGVDVLMETLMRSPVESLPYYGIDTRLVSGKKVDFVVDYPAQWGQLISLFTHPLVAFGQGIVVGGILMGPVIHLGGVGSWIWNHIIGNPETFMNAALWPSFQYTLWAIHLIAAGLMIYGAGSRIRLPWNKNLLLRAVNGLPLTPRQVSQLNRVLHRPLLNKPFLRRLLSYPRLGELCPRAMRRAMKEARHRGGGTWEVT